MTISLTWDVLKRTMCSKGQPCSQVESFLEDKGRTPLQLPAKAQSDTIKASLEIKGCPLYGQVLLFHFLSIQTMISEDRRHAWPPPSTLLLGFNKDRMLVFLV